MMINTGMDVGQVQDLASQLRQGADTLERVRAELTNQFQQTAWAGADRDQFQGHWEDEQCRKIADAVQLLTQTAVHLDTQARAQVDASAS